MIEWIDRLLSRWGRWSVRRESSALGYGSVSPMFRDCATGGGWSPEYDTGFTPRDLIECEAAVNGLPLVIRVVVIAHYQRGKGTRETAAACGVSCKTVTQYLGQAHEQMQRALDTPRTMSAESAQFS